MPITQGTPIKATIVTQASDVKAGCAYIPPPQPVTLACPVCGVQLQSNLAAHQTPMGLTMGGLVKFSCGWQGVLRNGFWIEVTHK